MDPYVDSICSFDKVSRTHMKWSKTDRFSYERRKSISFTRYFKPYTIVLLSPTPFGQLFHLFARPSLSFFSNYPATLRSPSFFLPLSIVLPCSRIFPFAYRISITSTSIDFYNQPRSTPTRHFHHRNFRSRIPFRRSTFRLDFGRSDQRVDHVSITHLG